MANILSIASTGLNAFQRALEVTGNNIANSSNKAYSRQSIHFTPMPSQRYNDFFIGNGVKIDSIIRNSDQFAVKQTRDTLTAQSQFEAFYSQAIQIDRMLTQPGISLTSSLEAFFNAANQLNQAPDNLVSRELMLQQSRMMVSQFKSLESRLDEFQQNNSKQINEITNQINQLADDIAKINEQLTAQPNSPELLDKRDALLKDLAKFTDVSVVANGGEGVSVAIGNGQMLVMGNEARHLSINASGNGQSGTEVLIENGAGKIQINSSMHSGMLGGLLDFEQNILAYGSQLIGQMSIGFASMFNDQHKLGLDLNNQIGKDYFTDFNSAILQTKRSIPSLNNTGTGVLSVAISDVSQTQLSDYQLVVTDTATNEIKLIRQSDGKTSVLNWTSSPPTPPAAEISIDGMTITIDNIANLANNDSFMISPTRGAASNLELLLKDPREIAFASAVRATSSLTNLGTGQIALSSVLNTDTPVTKDYSIQFISPTQYNIVNETDSITTGPFSFTPNADNTVMIPDSTTPSYSVVISGIPQTGDSFTTNPNTGGVGDNSNGLKLAALQDKALFDGGVESLFDKYSGFITEVGSLTYQAKIAGDASEILHQQALDYQESKSGVNLDEEASNLLRFTQAYQAASRVMAVSNQMMDALFAALG